MNDEKIIHLYSGGIDSTVMLYDHVQMHFDVHCLLFNYKQCHLKELDFAVAHCDKLNVPYTKRELPQFVGSTLTDGEGTIVVPNRNAIMLSIAANLAVQLKAGVISYACNADDAELFADCRQEFINAMNTAIVAAGCNVRIWAPYVTYPKAKIVAIGRKLGVDFNQTWSCYLGDVEPCGQCVACQKRNEALR